MSQDPRSLAPLFDLSRDAVVALRDGRVLFANPAAEAMFSIREGDDGNAFLPSYILDEPSGRFIASGTVAGQAADISLTRTDDLTLVTLMPRQDTAAPPLAGERILNDMGSCLMNLRLAADGLVLPLDIADEKAKNYAALLYQSFYRLKRMLEHMSLASYLRRGAAVFKPRLIDLGRLCAELCDSVNALVTKMDLRVEAELPAEPCPGSVDPRLMETLLLNLLSNSLLHADPGDRVRVSLFRQGTRLVLAVDDPGAGMTPEKLTALFSGPRETALTDVAAGAGLGMSLVRGIAELHKGSVLVESREGAGTRVRVLLPYPSPEEEHLLMRYADEIPRGMGAILTELSVVLDKSFYTQKYMD